MSDDIIEIAGSPYGYSASQNLLLDEMARRVVAMRKDGKLSADALLRLRHYFRIKNIYHSNAIEGNSLNLGETRQVVEHGLTLTGKPLKDQAEAKNLAEALAFLEALATDTTMPITEADVRQIHFLILKDIDDANAGKYRTQTVAIGGSRFSPPGPESVPGQMAAFGQWLARASEQASQLGAKAAVLCAAVAHTWFVTIHPFIDGNGRTARLLMNLLLMRAAYPIAVIGKEDRLRYYDALEASQASDLTPFVALLAESLCESLEEYEGAVSEDRELREWTASLAQRLGAAGEMQARNRYAVWRNAMGLLAGYFRQAVEGFSGMASTGAVAFREFGMLEFERYLALSAGRSVKRSWFFRVECRVGGHVSRYLFFFGHASEVLGGGVSVYLAREEPVGSFNYVGLGDVVGGDASGIHEIGYDAAAERFLVRDGSGEVRQERLEVMVQGFLNGVLYG